ncbi:MAG: acyl-ACP--UDP-N-acetylglucosamine O-acyltransferase [Bacteroidetes bacterium]|jgi:UDP-N-acetylglucosamine acyltransferase|nr:acyl-ACP--UDP-N-acetylglucosamine O-acyltransferase [Bacteroidota bacterium]
MSVNIDPRAAVHSNAHLGENVTIGPFAVVEADTVVGDGTIVGAHAIVNRWTTLGRECRIAPFASIGGAPQDLKYKGEKTTLTVGDRCDIREYVTLNRGTQETGETIIGSNGLFMANTHVAHDCRVGDNCIMANSAALGGHVHMGNFVIIGGLTPVHQFTHLGEHAMIGGGYRVTKDVPPYVRAGREPMSFEGLNSVGLRRRGFKPETIALIDKTYMLLYQSNLNVSQAVERIKAEVELIPEVKTILDFIAKSKRGIIPAHTHR